MFKTTSESQPYNLRNNDLLRPPAYRSAAAQNSLQYKGAIEFNKAIESGVDVNCLFVSFKKKLCEYVKTRMN